MPYLRRVTYSLCFIATLLLAAGIPLLLWLRGLGLSQFYEVTSRPGPGYILLILGALMVLGTIPKIGFAFLIIIPLVFAMLHFFYRITNMCMAYGFFECLLKALDCDCSMKKADARRRADALARRNAY